MTPDEARANEPKVVMVDGHNHVLGDIGRETEKQTVTAARKKAAL
jgi:aspartate 1-decarboxylase